MHHKTTVLVMNWVPMARRGLILWENEAAGSRKVSKYLLGPRDAIFLSKMFPKTKQKQKTKLHLTHTMDHKTTVLVMNWVPMARHGLILWENEATGSRKVSKYLLGPRDAIFLYKMPPETKKSRNPEFFPHIYV